MNAKPFLLFLVAALALGGSLSGAFVGGVAVGKGQGKGEAVAQSSVPPQPTSASGQGFTGDITPDQLSQLRQQFQEQLGGGGGEFGGGGRLGGRRGGGLTGPIETIEGSTLTITTSQGPLQATIGADTTIRTFTQGTLEDLRTGLQVTVVGARGEDGTVQARSILITPEGDGGLFGDGFSRERFQQQQGSP
jgi:hypothetical protein